MYKIKDLDRAIVETIWPDKVELGYETLKSGSRWSFHREACIIAFVKNEENENTTLLRWAMDQIGKKGIYPMEMWEKGDLNGNQ